MPAVVAARAIVREARVPRRWVAGFSKNRLVRISFFAATGYDRVKHSADQSGPCLIPECYILNSGGDTTVAGPGVWGEES